MKFARKILGKFLYNKYIKGFCCFVYVLYLVIASYGVSTFQMETSPNRIFFQNKTANYFDQYDRYFRDKPTFVQIVLTQEIDYSNASVQDTILKLHETLEQQPFVRKEFTVSWLKDWIYYTRKASKSLTDDQRSFVQLLKQEIRSIKSPNISNCGNAIAHLKEMMNEFSQPLSIKMSKLYHLIEDIPCSARQLLGSFLPKQLLDKQQETIDLMSLFLWTVHQLSQLNDKYELDVVFDAKLEKIKVSRFLIVVENGSDPEVQQTLRRIARESDIPGVKVFNMQAIISDEVEIVKITTIWSTLSTTMVVVLISLILIPNPICSLWVSASIASIEFGVVGLMALWGVQLNAVSMVNLIMCVGFSVDFSAHISYAFLSAPGTNVNQRVEMALYAVGVPILLGGFSTIVGILPICFSQSPAFIIFFKVVFIVVSLGMLHALVFLPVFMSIFDVKNSLSNFNRSKSKTLDETASENNTRDSNLSIKQSSIIDEKPFTELSCIPENGASNSKELILSIKCELKDQSFSGSRELVCSGSYKINDTKLDKINLYETDDV